MAICKSFLANQLFVSVVYNLGQCFYSQIVTRFIATGSKKQENQPNSFLCIFIAFVYYCELRNVYVSPYSKVNINKKNKADLLHLNIPCNITTDVKSLVNKIISIIAMGIWENESIGCPRGKCRRVKLIRNIIHTLAYKGVVCDYYYRIAYIYHKQFI